MDQSPKWYTPLLIKLEISEMQHSKAEAILRDQLDTEQHNYNILMTQYGWKRKYFNDICIILEDN